MDRFRSILAVYSHRPGADSLLRQAVGLARTNAARLTIVQADGRPRSAEMLEEARCHLRRIAPWVAEQGVADITTDVLEGTPYKAIVRRVLLDGHDLVVVNADEGNRLPGLVGGATVRNLLQECPCAVWALKGGRPSACDSVIAAVDPVMGDAGDVGFSARVLDLAVALARSNAARLDVVHCWDIDGAEGDVLRSEVHIETKRRIIDRHRLLRREAIEALLAPHGPVTPDVHLPRGRPEFEIAELADRLTADILVMGTTGRSGLARLLRGDLAGAMLGIVRCGVLVVKPDGFRTQVAVSRAA